MFQRTLEGQLPKTSFFLFGPRQIGKSTLIRKTNPDLIIDLLDPDEHLSYNKNPNLLREQMKEVKPDAAIFIDEVQRVPKLLDVIHSIMEDRPKLKFILCGSSARKLRRGASNLLGGRALYRTMHPLTLDEMSNRFHLPTVLSYGSLPKIYENLTHKKVKEAQDLLRTYVTTYLKEEIKAEALVRNLHDFQHFLDVAAAQYAEQVNFTAISRECQVALSTVKEYYSILEDTLIGFLLFPHLRSVRKRMSHQPKFYFFDNGVTRAALGTLQDQPAPPEQERLFEQWIVQEIVRLNEYRQRDWKLSFWRTSHGAEVDLLISRGTNVLYAIECKWTRQPSASHLSGLRSFHEVYPQVPCFLAAPIRRPLRISFVRILPPEQLLLAL